VGLAGAGAGLTMNGTAWNIGAMPQVQLPIFPAGTTHITQELAFEQRDGEVVYFNGHLPVFTHAAKDLGSFRLYTSQLILNGTASQGEIVRAFGVPLVTVKRSVKRLRQSGAEAFFRPAARRSGSKLTPERLAQCQGLLDQGQSVPQISEQSGVKRSTLHKAIDQGRLKQAVKKKALRKASGRRSRR